MSVLNQQIVNQDSTSDDERSRATDFYASIEKQENESYEREKSAIEQRREALPNLESDLNERRDSLVEIENSIYLFLIVLASIMYAFSANWVNKLNENSSIELAFCSISLAAIVSFPIFFITISILDLQILNLVNSIGFFSFISASILGIICTGFAISLFFYLIKKKSAIFASQSNYLIPCFGFLWSFIFLTEKLSFNLLAGLILIVLGGYLVDKKN